MVARRAMELRPTVGSQKSGCGPRRERWPFIALGLGAWPGRGRGVAKGASRTRPRGVAGRRVLGPFRPSAG